MSYQRLADTIERHFGVIPITADFVTVIWSAEFLSETIGIPAAKEELSFFNMERIAKGMVPCYPPARNPLY